MFIICVIKKQNSKENFYPNDGEYIDIGTARKHKQPRDLFTKLIENLIQRVRYMPKYEKPDIQEAIRLLHELIEERPDLILNLNEIFNDTEINNVVLQMLGLVNRRGS
jgi:hypothetical protein